MQTLRYISAKTPTGDFHIIFNSSEVALASGFGSLEALSKRLPGDIGGFTLSVAKGHEYERLVSLYFTGDRDSLKSIPYLQTGSDFQESIWSAMEKIPYGEVSTYKELAASAGYPGAVRAVGTTCGSNRLVLLIPCHRIVRSDGQVGEYVYGRSIKQYLLDMES